MLASENGHVEVVRLLLEAGADKNLGNIIGSTALVLAAQPGREEVLRLLLEAGADTNLADNGDSTALMLASANATMKSCGCCWRPVQTMTRT